MEGPFISQEKKGAHPSEHIRNFDDGFQDVVETYGSISDVAIVTLAPELNNSKTVIEEFIKRGVVVSLGKYALLILISMISVLGCIYD